MRLSKLNCASTICELFTDISECEFIQCWQLERTVWWYLPECWHACSYLTPGKRRRLGGNSKVEVGTEENCLKRWLTILGAYIMESFFTKNYSQQLPRGQSFLKMYKYTNTQTHAHMQEHLFIRHNKLGSVLFYLTSHKEVSALIFSPPFRRSQVHATLKKNWALLHCSWNWNIHRYSYEFLSTSHNLGLLILHFLQQKKKFDTVHIEFY